MARAASPSLARQLGSLFEGGSVAGLSDRQLVERFAAARDDDAFAALVDRHGPMVLGVCRQLLGDHQHAEDAFQAVFLVLARKAPSLRQPELLGNWLYGVALRTARKARGRLARRCRTEEAGAADRPEAQPAAQAEPLLEREQAEALHVEIDRLPGAFRAPVLLCYFEGLTLDEAAHRLRWPVGTTRSRLARAREKLRRGLTRRGFALPGAALAPRASVSSLLCDSTTRAAIAFAARQAAAGGSLSASAATLAQEVLNTMLLHKLRLATMSLLLLAIVATGAAYHSSGALARSREGEPPGEPIARTARTEPRPAEAPPPPEARMTVAGRVLDPAGKPSPNARVAVLADRKGRVGDIDGRHLGILMGTAAADADGHFALDVPAIPPRDLQHLTLIAAAPGRALTAVDLKADAGRQETSVTLAPEQPIEGRLVDVQGQPAAGVVVRLAKLGFKHEFLPYDAKGGPSLWPPPATTGADGRFRMLGLAAGAPATFEVEDPRYAHQGFSLGAQGAGEGKEAPRSNSTVTLRPAQALDVRVLHDDDGTPAVGATIAVQAIQDGWLRETVYARTDSQGRVHVVGWPGGGYRVHAYPPQGEPYFVAWRDIDWPTAAVEQSVTLKLWRGVPVPGRVIEDPSGQPVAGAWISYRQRERDNPRRANLLGTEAVSGPDGAFTLVLPRGPGHLLVQGPTADYVNVTTNSNEMGTTLRPVFNLYPHAHAVLDIPDGEATHPVELHLRRGVTGTGRVVGPDGNPVAEAYVFGRSYVPYNEHAFPLVGFNGAPPKLEIKDGRFEIPGCDPDKPAVFYFLDVKDRLGATVEISGRSAATGPVTVRLQPTATARFLLKDPDGKPIANGQIGWPDVDLKLVVTRGHDFEEVQKDISLTLGDYAHQGDLDPVHDRGPGGGDILSGPDGRITMINLIPGAPYRFHGRNFSPEPGQTVDLGDIVRKPPG
jgi:RNA polymerase sigma factor (sigma-70 family)